MLHIKICVYIILQVKININKILKNIKNKMNIIRKQSKATQHSFFCTLCFILSYLDISQDDSFRGRDSYFLFFVVCVHMCMWGVIVSHMNTYLQTFQVVYIKYMQLSICQSYFNKVFFVTKSLQTLSI
jgi:hypothetical protein